VSRRFFSFFVFQASFYLGSLPSYPKLYENASFDLTTGPMGLPTPGAQGGAG
jgi:hypothetical protein